jgi:hypothetical protein
MISAGLLLIGTLAIASANEPTTETAYCVDGTDFGYCTSEGTPPEVTPLSTPKGFVICPPGYPVSRDYPPDPPPTGCWDIDDPTKTSIDPADF